jgi:hypothetical protein
MASAGVVGMSEVVVPNANPVGNGLKGSPAMWSLVWVGISVFVLFMFHLALMGRAAR